MPDSDSSPAPHAGAPATSPADAAPAATSTVAQLEATETGTARPDAVEQKSSILSALDRTDAVHGSGSGMGAGPTAG